MTASARGVAPASLTTKQKELLDAIHAYWHEHGVGPSFRDLRDRTGYHSTSAVAYGLHKLETLGLVVRTPWTPRHVRPAPVGRAKAACSICGIVGRVVITERSLRIICESHGPYFEFFFERGRRKDSAAA